MRHLFEYERSLVAYLFEHASIPIDLDALEVQQMSDGGMGSLAFAPLDSSRKFGSSSTECHFYDVDGVPVLVMLILNQDGAPFEIDIWRVDFAPTVGRPLRMEIVAGIPGKFSRLKFPR